MLWNQNQQLLHTEQAAPEWISLKIGAIVHSVCPTASGTSGLTRRHSSSNYHELFFSFLGGQTTTEVSSVFPPKYDFTGLV